MLQLVILQKDHKRPRNIERVLDNVTALKKALVWCKHHGLEVLDADITGSRPEVLIETSSHCAALVREGLAAEVGSQVANGIRARVMCASIEGCQIKWIERGN